MKHIKKFNENSNLDKTPTAEDFLNNWSDKKGYVSVDQYDDIDECLREFAEMHLRKFGSENVNVSHDIHEYILMNLK